MAVNLLAQIEKQGEKCEEYDTVCKQQDKWRGEQVLRRDFAFPMHYYWFKNVFTLCEMQIRTRTDAVLCDCCL